MTTPQDLRDAALMFAARTDRFAEGKAETCLDLAQRLDRFGGFASDRQADFAAKLVSWAAPKETPAVQAVRLPNIYGWVSGGLRLDLDVCKVVQFQSGAVAVVALEFGAGTFGMIDEDGAFRRFRACTDEIVEVLLDVEQRGLDAVKEIGRSIGRCCVCSRPLTNPESIEAGIGPICAGRF